VAVHGVDFDHDLVGASLRAVSASALSSPRVGTSFASRSISARRAASSRPSIRVTCPWLTVTLKRPISARSPHEDMSVNL
jgi:hypothetical protein